MKKITIQNFLAKYVLSFIFLAILIYAIFEILNFINFITIIVAPVLAAKLSCMMILRNKEIIEPTQEILKKFLYTHIGAGIVSYFVLFYFDIYLFCIYMAGVIVGYKVSVKSVVHKGVVSEPEVYVENSTNTSDSIDNNMTLNKTENIISKYKLNKFNDENIIDFLRMNNLNSENYFYVTELPTMGSYALFGSLASTTMTNYIASFDREYIYLFELSKLSNTKIENCVVINIKDIDYMKSKNVLFGIAKRINVRLKDNQKFEFQCNKKVPGIENQLASVEKFIELV